MPQPPPLPPHQPIPVLPPARGRYWPLIVAVAAFVLLAVIGLGVVIRREIRRRSLPPVVAETSREKYAEASGAFAAKTEVPANGAEARAIRTTFDRLVAAIAASDAHAATQCYNFDRLVGEMKREGTALPVPSSEEPQFIQGIETGFGRAIVGQSPYVQWARYEIKRLKLLGEGNEAVAYVRAWTRSGLSLKLRYWLRRENGTWRIYDTEDLDGGVRMSSLMGALSQRASASPTSGVPLASAVSDLQGVIPAMVDGKLDVAEKALHTLDAVSMPPEIDALRWLFWGAVHVRENKAAQAMEDLDKCVALRPDVPAAESLRAAALNALGRYQEAITHVQNYVNELGADDNTNHYLGDALAGLHRPDEAADAYRHGLDDTPDSVENLVGLSKVLPKDRRSEVRDRFLRTTRKHAAFMELAGAAVHSHDTEYLQELLSAYGQSKPADPWFDYYRAELLILQKNYRPAAQILKASWGLLPTGEQKSFRSEYMNSLILAGDPVGAYRGLGGTSEGFQQTADSLLRRRLPQSLRELVAARRQDYPADDWVPYYEGSAFEQQKNYAAAAERFFAAADAAGEKPEAQQFRARAVSASYSAGTGLAAYRRLRSASAFDQLAGLSRMHADTNTLASLVSERRRDDPTDPNVTYWDARLRYSRNDYAGAVALLAASGEALDSKQASRSDLLIRCLTRLGRFDEAMQEARRTAAAGEVSPWYAAIIEANRGNVAGASAALDELLKDEDNYDLPMLYGDRDLGPALRSPAFAGWRTTHPPPPPPRRSPTTAPSAHK